MTDDTPTREELIAICESAFTPESEWSDRDSSAAHRQLGECYALLKAGCEFWVRTERNTNWVSIEFRGFDAFEYGDDGPLDHDRYYVPTAERVAANPGKDWY